jgi:hypothetical protein
MGTTTCARAASAAIVLIGTCSAAVGQEPDAKGILKKMSDYLAAQETITLAFDSDIEVVTPQLEKIQFTNSGRVVLSRPDKLMAERAGGYSDVELTFDGKTLTVLGRHLNGYVQADVPGTVDQLIDALHSDYGASLPGADLLLSQPYQTLVADVFEAKHIGLGVIGGVECEHLAFRNHDTDWQLWVATGDRPYPCKYVITSKTVAGAPQYTVRITEWTTDEPAAEVFSFTPPEGAQKLDAAVLAELDELPPGASPAGEQ